MYAYYIYKTLCCVAIILDELSPLENTISEKILSHETKCKNCGIYRNLILPFLAI